MIIFRNKFFVLLGLSCLFTTHSFAGFFSSSLNPAWWEDYTYEKMLRCELILEIKSISKVIIRKHENNQKIVIDETNVINKIRQSLYDIFYIKKEWDWLIKSSCKYYIDLFDKNDNSAQLLLDEKSIGINTSICYWYDLSEDSQFYDDINKLFLKKNNI